MLFLQPPLKSMLAISRILLSLLRETERKIHCEQDRHLYVDEFGDWDRLNHFMGFKSSFRSEPCYLIDNI